MEHYPFSATHGGYHLFVGRIDPEKGVHHAIDAAVRLNKRLIIAAKLDDHVSTIKKYFEEEIRPRFEKHPDLIEWVGEVDETQRNELMKNAHCLVHAVTWPEPFGLTLIESMACGAPVVAFRDGAIPEVIKDGVTGFVVSNVDEMVEAIKKIDTIDRGACRAHALTAFSAQKMAEGYEAMYRKAIAEKKGTVSPIVSSAHMHSR
jgi:glycosyltransferase involved in cell wall biosynthesis